MQKHSSFVPAGLKTPRVSLTFVTVSQVGGHGHRCCLYALHCIFPQQAPSCCNYSILSPCLHSFFLLYQKWFPALFWHSYMFFSPADSFSLLNRALPVFPVHIFLVSVSSKTWLAFQYLHSLWFPPDRMCSQAVLVKSPSASSFSSLRVSSHTQSPGFSSCLHHSSLLLQVLFPAIDCLSLVFLTLNNSFTHPDPTFLMSFLPW